MNLTYFKNGFLNLTSDVPKNVSYVFNNANVKDGLFTYTSSQLNSSYSVAKVSYSDKNDNFKGVEKIIKILIMGEDLPISPEDQKLLDEAASEF